MRWQKTFLLVSLIENSLSILLLIFSTQGQIPLVHTFEMPYFYFFIFFTYSLDQNSYEVSFGVLILLSPHH